MEFHRAMTQQELERDGHSSREARLAAHKVLGNLTRSRKDAVPCGSGRGSRASGRTSFFDKSWRPSEIEAYSTGSNGHDPQTRR